MDPSHPPLDARPPLPVISFRDDAVPEARRRQVAQLAASLLRAAAEGEGPFAELWLAEALGEAVADPDTAALVLCDLADLAVLLATTLGQLRDVPADRVVDHLAARWTEEA
jgi:hypothetical protein